MDSWYLLTFKHIYLPSVYAHCSFWYLRPFFWNDHPFSKNIFLRDSFSEGLPGAGVLCVFTQEPLSFGLSLRQFCGSFLTVSPQSPSFSPLEGRLVLTPLGPQRAWLSVSNGRCAQASLFCLLWRSFPSLTFLWFLSDVSRCICPFIFPTGVSCASSLPVVERSQPLSESSLPSSCRCLPSGAPWVCVG